MFTLEIHPVAVVKFTDIPPQERCGGRGPKYAVFPKIFKAMERLKSGEALRVQHNARVPSEFTARLHIAARKRGLIVGCAVRGKEAYLYWGK